MYVYWFLKAQPFVILLCKCDCHVAGDKQAFHWHQKCIIATTKAYIKAEPLPLTQGHLGSVK